MLPRSRPRPPDAQTSLCHLRNKWCASIQHAPHGFGRALLIGAEDYGKYAAIFALPAFLQSGIEGFALLNLSRGFGGRRLWSTYAVLSALAMVASAICCGLLFGFESGCWAAALGAALFYRAASSSLVYSSEATNYVRINVTAEGITLLVYAVVLLAVWQSRLPNFAIPISMVIAANAVAGTYMFWANNKTAIRTLSTRQPKFDLEGFRFLWARSYEDLSLTLMPLFVANAFGLIAAGEFRVIVSGMKVLSKLFPFRYEVILRGIKAGEFNVHAFMKVAALFVVLGFFVAFVLYFIRGQLFLAEDTQMWIIALSTGALVTTLAAFPVATLYSSMPVVISGVTAIATLAAVTLGHLHWFLALFIAMNVLTFCAVIYIINKNDREGRIIHSS